MFQKAYREKPSSAAQKCFQALSPISDVKKGANKNRLFNAQMIDFLYATGLFEGCSKIEGSFSSARAVA